MYLCFTRKNDSRNKSLSEISFSINRVFVIHNSLTIINRVDTTIYKPIKISFSRLFNADNHQILGPVAIKTKINLIYTFLIFSICQTALANDRAISYQQVKNTGKLLSFKSLDDKWKIDIGGRLQLDAAKYFDDDPPSLESGFEVRRARLYVEGTVWNNWDFKVQYDFTTLDKSDTRDITGFNDLYIRYTGFDFGSITAGHFKEPFSLDQLTATKHLIFMERALPNALVPGRNIGISLNSYGENWTATAGLYGGSMEQPTHDGHGVTGRATFFASS